MKYVRRPKGKLREASGARGPLARAVQRIRTTTRESRQRRRGHVVLTCPPIRHLIREKPLWVRRLSALANHSQGQTATPQTL